MSTDFDFLAQSRLVTQVQRQFVATGRSVMRIFDDSVEFDAFAKRVRNSDAWLREVPDGDIQACLEMIYQDEGIEVVKIPDPGHSQAVEQRPFRPDLTVKPKAISGN